MQDLGRISEAGGRSVSQKSDSRLDQRRLYARFWQSARGFWHGRRSWRVWLVTALLIAIVLVQLLVQYRLNLWNRDFFNALGRRDGAALWSEAQIFLPLAAASILLAAATVWARMRVQRKWREALTVHVASFWLLDCHYSRLDYEATGNKNPEYRINDDVRVATDAPVDLALGLLSSLLTATIFIGVLWRVGGNISITVFGLLLSIPGYLVVGVMIYSTLVTATMMIVGRFLTHVIQDMNQAEAEFRAAAMTLREVGEETVPPGKEPKERRALWFALRQVIARWRDLARQLVQTTLVSQGNVLLAPVVAWILCAPKYLAGTMSLGELTQVAAAFVIVQGAFNWLVDNYQRLADWRSAVNRLATLLLALDDLCADQNARSDDKALGTMNKVPP